MSFSWLARRFQKGATSRDVAVLTIGTAIAQAITLASTPILSRIYSPAAFGELSFFLAISSIAATVITLRYEASVVLPKRDQDAGTLALISIVSAMLVSMLLLVLSLLFSEQIERWMGASGTAAAMPLAFVMAGLSAFLAIGSAWLNRLKKFQAMAGLRILQSGGVAALSLLFGFLPLIAFSGLIAAQLAIGLLVSVLAIYLSRQMMELWEKDRFSAIASQYQSSPKYLLPTALLDVATLQLPILLITSSFGAESAGQFGMAMRVLAIPAAVLGAAVGQVFVQKIAAAVHDDVALVRTIYYKVSFFLFMAGILPALLLAFWGEDLFVYLLGESWGPSGQIAEVFIFSSFIYFVFSPTSTVLQVLGKQQILLAFGVLQLIYRVGAALWATDVMTYVHILVICEFINVLMFEFVLLKQLDRAVKGR